MKQAAPPALAGLLLPAAHAGLPWRTQGGRYDVGVSEDPQAGASPDIVFIFAVARDYR